MKGIYAYWDNKLSQYVYIGKDSHIGKNQRHRDHMNPSKYDEQQINRVLQNNPDRYEYSVIWATEDCTDLKLNKMEILFGKIYNPKFNFGKFGKGGCNGHTEETRKKMSESHTGKQLSEEHKKNLSKSLSGENNPMYGRTGELNPMYNKTHSPESREKISINTSKATNTTGYLNVYKHKGKTYKQGFAWCYTYRKDGKRKSISSVDIEKLEEKVKAKGLKWRKLE